LYSVAAPGGGLGQYAVLDLSSSGKEDTGVDQHGEYDWGVFLTMASVLCVFRNVFCGSDV